MRHSDVTIPGYFQSVEVDARGVNMQAVIQGYRGLSLIISLNWDRIFTLGTVIVGLLAGAFLGTAIMPLLQ